MLIPPHETWRISIKGQSCNAFLANCLLSLVSGCKNTHFFLYSGFLQNNNHANLMNQMITQLFQALLYNQRPYPFRRLPHKLTLNGSNVILINIQFQHRV